MPFDPSLDHTAHRPWPIPDRPWVMTQSWHDLLFAHWRVDERLLRPHIPHAFDIDRFDGSAWLGIVPFTMTHVAARGTPALPWLSAFAELNVRTYVSPRDGKRGVFFFSLDAARLPAVLAARALLSLPYFHASMQVRRDGDRVHYVSRRRRAGRRSSPATSLRGRHSPPRAGRSSSFWPNGTACTTSIGWAGRPGSRFIMHRGPCSRPGRRSRKTR